ncbi:MAG: spore protease YyaC [Firmicutes bacterium]|jgi:putative sporulation protein YyaC|nr:spore protease YyaC [Bacillota bacterium]
MEAVMAKKNISPQHFAQIRYNQPGASGIISHALTSLSRESFRPEDILILCIGTDRSTGDSLGPLTGSRLLEHNPPFQVLGTLEHPVHAANLAETLDRIKASPPKWTVAIDASLGNMDGVGLLNIGMGSLQPGAGVNKRLPQVGDVYITGIVNVGGFMEYFVLQNTRLSLVTKMAAVICEGLLAAYAVNTRAGLR